MANTVESLRESLPEAARDLKVNLQNVLQESSLTAAQRWGVAVACAIASRNQTLVQVLLDAAREQVDASTVEDARAAAALMAMNNVYYRFKHMEQAKAHAKAQGLSGADYPWESAASGKEVAPGGFATGRHVTAGIGWAVWQYWLATGDKTWLAERGYPMLSAIADHFASRAKKNPTTGQYEIKTVFGPDELKGRVDNNTYTNAMAANCLRYAGEARDNGGGR